MKEPKKELWTIKAIAESPKLGILELNGFIDIWDWDGISTSAAGFSKAFKQLEEQCDEIHIKIGSCYGGVCYEGLAIYDQIQNSTKTVITDCRAFAASMGFIIWLAAKPENRRLAKTAQVMGHGVSACACGNIADIQNCLDSVVKTQAIIEGIILDATGGKKTADDVAAMMLKDTYLNATEAEEWGFVAAVEESSAKAVDINHIKNLDPRATYELFAQSLERKKPIGFKSFFNAAAKIIGSALPTQNKPQNKMAKQYNTTATVEVALYVDAAGETAAVGDKAFTDEAMTVVAADGDYLVSGGDIEGSTITIASGEISSITPAEGANGGDGSQGDGGSTNNNNEPSTAALEAKFTALEAKYSAVANELNMLKKKGTTTPTQVPGQQDNKQDTGKQEPKDYTAEQTEKALANRSKKMLNV